VFVLFCCIYLDLTKGFFLNTRSRKSHSQYGPPKQYIPQKAAYKAPIKITYDSPAVELNEIDDGYGSPAAPIISYQPETTYEEPIKVYKEPSKPIYKPPMKMRYKKRHSMKRMPLYRKIKMRKPSYMFPKMPRYKFPKMRLPKFMLRMPKFPKFPRMKFPMYKPSRPIYGKPVKSHKHVMQADHGGYKHMNDLDYSGWTPIGMKYPEPEKPSYNAVAESPIVTIEDAYKSPSSKPIPSLPSGDGYGAPEVITAAPVSHDSYGVPQAAPVAIQPVYKEPPKVSYGTPKAPLVTYKEPEPAQAPVPSYVQPPADTYGKPAAEPIASVPAYKEPAPAAGQDTYGEPQAPIVTYTQPKPILVTTLSPHYNIPPVSYAQPTLPPQPAYTQAVYGAYNSPIEEPLFAYAPVSDLNNLAAIAAEDTYNAYAAPPSPGRYQATVDSNALAEEVQSGSVYVQPQPNSISYPSYGEKVPSSNQYGASEPLYYQSAPYSQTNYAYPSPAYQVTPAYQGTGGKSSASFSIHVNGKEHGHSYSHDHKV
jgi:hypothetical protein